MNIAGTEINLAFKALEVYVSGCKAPHCQGCHNSELWVFTAGDFYDGKIAALKDKALDLQKSGLAEWAWVLGGEPLDQDVDELCKLLDAMHECGLKTVLWTHYYEVPEKILQRVEYVKVGPYIQEGTSWIEPLFGVKLANKEQSIFPAGYVREMQKACKSWTNQMLLYCDNIDLDGDSKMALLYKKFCVLDKFWATVALSRVASSGKSLALLSALGVFSHCLWEDVEMFAMPHVLTALHSRDYELIELALQCLEGWDQPKHSELIKDLEFSESWLEDYRKSVLDYLHGLKESKSKSGQED